MAILDAKPEMLYGNEHLPAPGKTEKRVMRGLWRMAGVQPVQHKPVFCQPPVCWPKTESASEAGPQQRGASIGVQHGVTSSCPIMGRQHRHHRVHRQRLARLKKTLPKTAAAWDRTRFMA
jgi:hypothetical protein